MIYSQPQHPLAIVRLPQEPVARGQSPLVGIDHSEKPSDEVLDDTAHTDRNELFGHA